MSSGGLVTAAGAGTALIIATVSDRADSTTVSVTGAPAVLYRQVSAGFSHKCALSTTGQAYCWGSNSARELGSVTKERCGSRFCSSVPIAVPGTPSFVSINAGNSGSCGITADQRLFCWGNWMEMSTPAFPEPQRVDSVPVTSVAGGVGGTCWVRASGGVECAVKSGGYGIAGNGSTRGTSRGAVASPVEFASVAVGNDHACALARDGTAYCWGRNAEGQLGVGTTEFCTGQPCATTPTQVNTSVKFRSLSAGAFHTCGVSTEGQAYCWGITLSGDLGIDGSAECRANGGGYACATTPVQLRRPQAFTSVDVGVTSACGVTGNGRLYCWGRNGSGELGDGTTTVHPDPVRVADPR